MTVFKTAGGHRYFDDLCDDAVHEVGDRHTSVGRLDLEWTGACWVPVCPVDGVLLEPAAAGRLSCGTCQRTHGELSDLVSP
ncbi:hypothetical protein ACQP2Y_21290 [Actinoplanes sp. CA-051413]|uniref:hypothetical protein n=1 Tax=Actinoplanes sp. CA-051413 TaxID=3239899 RepID=UPI003D970FCA